MMNKKTFALIALTLATFTSSSFAQRQMETLGRGVVAMRTSSTAAYVGWRLLGTDPADTKFNLYRVTSGVTNLIAANVTNSCNYSDANAAQASAHSWFVQPILNSVTQANSVSYSMPANAAIQQYISIPLTPPPDGVSFDGVPYTMTANDCSAADVDGDGEYEIILKWDPSNSHDNSQSGFTGNTFLDCYKLNGTRLWRIDLGPNIRSGAHYMDFMVFDYDGDGKAELMCRTAPGSLDASGNYVGSVAKWQNANGTHPTFNNTDDYRFNHPGGVTNGYVLHGPEFLSVFNGQTGVELATTTFYPKRDQDNNDDNPSTSRMNTVWGDNYGNRIDRFLAGVAYCDGLRPSAIFCRGYYTRAYLAAWDWRNGSLSLRWTFNSNDGNSANLAYRGQGAHSLTIGDVDGDGKDEITFGACVIDDNGTGLYSTGLGHGDALHMSDMNPTRPGIEVWMVHESPSSYGPNGLEYRDAKNGSLISSFDGQNADVGRGVAIDIDPRYPGYEMWGSRGGLMTSSGAQIWTSHPSSMNFACWWDADTIREILDGTTVSKWNYVNNTSSSILSPGGLSSNNSTKSTPCLSADLFGDWREEVIWRTSANSELRIFTTTTVATNRIYTLMHDPQYRLAIAWQNTGYNQPPHPGFNIGPDMYLPPLAQISDAQLAWRGSNGGNAWDAANNWFVNGIWTNNVITNFTSGNSVLFDLRASNNTSVTVSSVITPASVKVHSPSNFTFVGSGSLSGSGRLFKAGSGKLTIANTNNYIGETLVSGGQLIVNGALTASPVTVEARGEPWGRARIGGNGRLGQGLTVQADCGIIVGPGVNSPGMFTITNGLTELGGVVNQFDLSNDPAGVTKTNDRVNIIGNLTLSGTNIIEITQLDGSLGGGVYPLITYTGTLTGGLPNLALTGSFIQPLALTNPPGMIALIALIPGSQPFAPTSLAATPAGAFQINLAWTDNSPDENAFLIERSANNTNSFAQIVVLAPNISNYQDTGLTASTTYYYRVRGTNLAGASAFSNIASATTTPPPQSLTWRGDGTGNVWDSGGAFNWYDSANLVVYNDGANVTFDQSGSNNVSVLLTGTLQPATVTVNATKNYTFNSTNGFLAGAMSLTKSGNGTLTLSSSNGFSGGANVNAGNVTLGSTSGAGNGPLRFNGGTVSFVVGSQPTYANALVINSNSTILSQGGNNNIVSGAWSGSNATLNITVASGTFSIGGNMTGFSGNVALGSSGGTFRFNGSTGSANTSFDLGAGAATLNNRNGVTVTLGALSGGSGTFLNGAGASDAASFYIVGGKNLNTTFAGTIKDSSSLRTTTITKTGTGVWTLTGTNTYSGTTTVSVGTLLVNGSHTAATNSVTVATAGTLGGNGIIGGNTTVSGKLSPGISIGRLTFNQNLTLAPSSTSIVELSKLPLTNDVVRVFGNLTLGGSLTALNVSPDAFEAGDSFQLFDATSYNGSFTNLSLPALEFGLEWETNSLATNGTLSIIAVTNAPYFSSIGAQPQFTSAIITWNTPSNVTSQVVYGLTTSYGNISLLRSAQVTSHAVLLTGLTPETTYFFRVLAQTEGGTLRSTATSFTTAGSLIVDNEAALYSGSWTLGTSATDKYGSYYQYAAVTGGFIANAEATYIPNIPTLGLYDVFEWHPAGSGRTTNAPITIYYNGGAITRSLNQTINGGAWQLVASNVNFAAGTGGFAIIANNTGETNVVVMADAMRWSYVAAQDNPADNSVPAWWSDFYFNGAVDGSVDSDGDGFSNHREYILGTDPTDAASTLLTSHTLNTDNIQLNFSPMLGGRSYKLATTTNLADTAWTLLNTSPNITNTMGTFSITNGLTPGSKFYRVSVQLAP